MKYCRKMIIVSVLIIFGFNLMMSAQEVTDSAVGASDSWKVLGTVSAKLNADHISIVAAIPYDNFSQLKFRVTSSPLNMQRIIVKYDDGGAYENADTRYTISQGGESRVIDIKGDKRKLKSVTIWYDPKSILHGRAVVTLLGIK